MPKVQIRGDQLTVTIPARVRKVVALRDGEQMDVTLEGGGSS